MPKTKPERWSRKQRKARKAEMKAKANIIQPTAPGSFKNDYKSTAGQFIKVKNDRDFKTTVKAHAGCNTRP